MDTTSVGQLSSASRNDGSRPQSIGGLVLAAGGARLIVLPVTGLCNLIIARLITVAVGIDQFGVVMLIATLSQLLMFADLGAGAAVSTARSQVQDTQSGVEQFRRTTLTAIRTVLCSAVLLGLLAVLVGIFGAWPTLLGVQDSRPAVNVAAVLAVSAFSASRPFAVGAAVLHGSGRLHEAVLLIGLSGPAALAMTVALYAVDAPPLSYALPIPVGALLGSMCCALRARKAVRSIASGIVGQVFRPRRFPGSAISATAAPMFVVMIGLPVALQSDRIVLSHRVDPASLSDYSYAAQLYTPLWSVVSVAALALWPYFAADNRARASVRNSWLTGLTIICGAGFVAAVGLLLLSRYVIHWMSAGTATPEWSLLVAFATLLFVQSLHVTTGSMLTSPRQLRFQAVCVVALVVTNLPLSWMLAPILGPTGPVLASAISVAACQLVPGAILAYRVTSTRSARRINSRRAG